MPTLDEERRDEERMAQKREDRDRELGLFACPRCERRIGDAERTTCDNAACQKPICVHCMTVDADGGRYCDVDCRIACYRDMIVQAKKYAEKAERVYSARIEELEKGQVQP